MNLEDAVKRIPVRNIPNWWIGDLAGMEACLSLVRQGATRQLAVSPGGRVIPLIEYGLKEPLTSTANFNSAIGARCISAYADRSLRHKPVIMLVGPVHGHEVEGLTGLINLISVLETGNDIFGIKRTKLQELGQACRLLVIPVANPDGLARFAPKTLHGMEIVDVQWWGQGAWRDGTLCGHVGCKTVHPMCNDRVSFLGCYFNDAGINPAHDEFFSPMGPESAAILDLARDEAPDIIAFLHSHAGPPSVHRPAYVPLEVQEDVRNLVLRAWDLYDRAGLKHSGVYKPEMEHGPYPASFNLTSAAYHVCGAAPFIYECTHGLNNKTFRPDLNDILEMQMLLYESIFSHALESL